MRIRLFQRTAAANDNGSTAPPPDPQAGLPPVAMPGEVAPFLSLRDLQEELNGIRRQVRELAQEREGLSLAAAHGDAASQARIAEIDEARQQFASLDETMTSAIRELAKHERAGGWRHHLPRMQRMLRVELRLHWTNLAPRFHQLMLGRQPHDYTALRAALQELEQLEAKTARQVADDALPHERVAAYVAGDHQDYARYRREKEACDQQRAKVVAEAAKELIAATVLRRPDELEQAIETARKRLANQPHPEHGIR